VSTTFKRWGQSELLPRYIFAKSIIAHQRVLEIGAVASTEGMSACFLLIRGARSVVACDSVLEATQQAQTRFGAPNLVFRPMVFDGLAEGSFDLVAITDLAPFIKAPTLFDRVLRLLTPQGYVLGALRNAAGLALSQVMDTEAEEPPPSYGQLLDLLMPRFPSIQMATQAPVLGYQLAFEEGDGLRIESSLASAGEAAYYIVIAGKEQRAGLGPLWVQLPPEPLAFNGAKLEEATLRARNWQSRFEAQKEAFERGRNQLEVLEQESQNKARQLREAHEALASLRVQLEAPAVDASASLELAEKVSKLSTNLSLAEGRANEAEARVSAMSVEIQRHIQALREAATDTLAAKESARIERTKREEAEAKAKELMERAAQIQEPFSLLASVETEQAKAEVEQARAETERVKAEAEQARAETEQVKAGAEQARVEAEQARVETEQARIEAEQVKVEAERARVEAEQAKEGVERAKKEVEVQKSTVEALRRELGVLQEKHSQAVSLQAEALSEAAEKESLLLKLQEQARAVLMLQSDLCAMREERDALKRNKGISSKEVLSEQRGAVGVVGEEQQKLERRMRELEGKLNQQNDEVEAMREDLALRSHSVERSKSRIKELESMLANAQTRSKEDQTLLGEEYDRLKQDNATLRSMLESLRAKLEVQKGEDKNADTRTAGTMLIALRKRYAEQEQVLAQTRETLERTEGELAAVHKQLKKFSQGAGGAELAKSKPIESIKRLKESFEAEADEIDIEEIDEIEPEEA